MSPSEVTITTCGFACMALPPLVAAGLAAGVGVAATTRVASSRHDERATKAIWFDVFTWEPSSTKGPRLLAGASSRINVRALASSRATWHRAADRRRDN